jgi:hypothetical protein
LEPNQPVQSQPEATILGGEHQNFIDFNSPEINQVGQSPNNGYHHR